MRKLTPGLLIFAAAALTSCKVQNMISNRDSWDCAHSGEKLCHDTVLQSSFWKTRTLPFLRTDCGPGNLSRVRVTTKPGDALLAVFTFGLVVKQRIEWDCAQPVSTDQPPIGN